MGNGCARAAGKAFLAGLRPADQAALVAFSEKFAWLAGATTTDKATVGNALANLRAEGATSVYDALFSASEPGLLPAGPVAATAVKGLILDHIFGPG